MSRIVRSGWLVDWSNLTKYNNSVLACFEYAGLLGSIPVGCTNER